MKKLLLALSLLMNIAFAQTRNNDWENPQLFEQNKEKPHATCMLFDKKEDVISDDYNRSPYYQLLNGKWKFVYVDKYAKRPTDFFRPDLDDSKSSVS
ncbi:hypothetical protein [Segetibacter koreensis]|uniref:hypothetical protein n=1 Tax=Segetibacter koreensis TaxID=398037 RepID=UPI0012FA4E1F|nr:hypothetical protein [Segetibacter koreensis]